MAIGPPYCTAIYLARVIKTVKENGKRGPCQRFGWQRHDTFSCFTWLQLEYGTFSDAVIEFILDLIIGRLEFIVFYTYADCVDGIPRLNP